MFLSRMLPMTNLKELRLQHQSATECHAYCGNIRVCTIVKLSLSGIDVVIWKIKYHLPNIKTKHSYSINEAKNIIQNDIYDFVCNFLHEF